MVKLEDSSHGRRRERVHYRKSRTGRNYERKTSRLQREWEYRGTYGRFGTDGAQAAAVECQHRALQTRLMRHNARDPKANQAFNQCICEHFNQYKYDEKLRAVTPAGEARYICRRVSNAGMTLGLPTSHGPWSRPTRTPMAPKRYSWTRRASIVGGYHYERRLYRF